MGRLKLAWAVKAIMVIVTSVLFPCIHGANLTVGGTSGWNLGSNIQDWAASTTPFTVGDNLVFSYTQAHNVVEVNQGDYDLCTTTNAMAIYNTGDTVIPLTVPGVRYFICGQMNHCQLGVKLSILVVYPTDDYSPFDDFTPPRGEFCCSRADKSHWLWVPLIPLIFTFIALNVIVCI